MAKVERLITQPDGRCLSCSSMRRSRSPLLISLLENLSRKLLLRNVFQQR